MNLWQKLLVVGALVACAAAVVGLRLLCPDLSGEWDMVIKAICVGIIAVLAWIAKSPFAGKGNGSAPLLLLALLPLLSGCMSLTFPGEKRFTEAEVAPMEIQQAALAEIQKCSTPEEAAPHVAKLGTVAAREFCTRSKDGCKLWGAEIHGPAT